jgi:hypothetical protein
MTTEVVNTLLSGIFFKRRAHMLQSEFPTETPLTIEEANPGTYHNSII